MNLRQTKRDTSFTVCLRRPHAEQLRFIKSPAKRKVVRAGRRGGKTVGCAIMAVQKFLEGRRVLYTAPTEDQVASFWFEVKRALQDPIDKGFFAKNESVHVVELPRTKQRIRAKTAWNAETLRGDYADVLILDEFQLMCEDAWETVGAPMLLDNDGDAIFIYTPPSIRMAGYSRATDRRYVSRIYARAASCEDGRWAAFHFTSHANPYISREALSDITNDMTVLSYRQEIEAEEIDEIPGALWTRANIEQNRIPNPPDQMDRIVVAVDPTCTRAGDMAGIVVCGLGKDGLYYVLRDCSLHGSPDEWARAAVSAYNEFEADRIVYETNQGGEMVEYTLRTIDPSVPLRGIRASRGKLVRAEPVAALSEQNKIRYVGNFAALEDELCSYTGLAGQSSPNRLDAFVYAITELNRRKPMQVMAH